MTDDVDLLSTSAMALSSSAILTALIETLRAKGILNKEDETAMYDVALSLLEDVDGADESGVVELAREVIEQQFRPE
jgi:hypothetical protein